MERWRLSPFGALTAHFFRRFFEPESDNADSPLRAGIGPVLALVAMPGGILSIVLFRKYSPMVRFFERQTTFNLDAASLPDKFFFLMASVTATVIVAALRWESLFPDRRDFSNLASLPLTLRSIFFAKLLALAAFATVFIGALNSISSWLFPMVALESDGGLEVLVRFVGGQVVAIGAASLCSFCLLLAVVGMLISVLPYGVFRKLTRYVQFVVVLTALAGFFLTPAFSPGLEQLRQGHWNEAGRFPAVWFVAWYYEIQGKASSEFTFLAGYARNLLWASLAAAGIAYAVSYRAYFLRSAEARDIIPSLHSLADRLFPILDRTLFRNGFERGTSRFALKTLFRSDRHAAILALALGTAGSLIMASLVEDPGKAWSVPSVTLLSAPLTLVYFVLAGLRFSFGLPSELRANWIFQYGVVDAATNPQRLATKLTTLLLSPVLALTAATSWVFWGAATAILHTSFVAMTSLLLCGLIFRDFGILPFTAPGNSSENPVAKASAFAVGYFFVVYGLTGIEVFMLRRPVSFGFYYVIAVTAYVLLQRTEDTGRGITYEAPVSSFEQLRLSE